MSRVSSLSFSGVPGKTARAARSRWGFAKEIIAESGIPGNVGRNTLRGPHTNVFDFALMRDFPVHESVGLQFRWEVFNLTNAVLFGQPSNNFSSGGSAGKITSLSGDPRVMQFALRLSF